MQTIQDQIFNCKSVAIYNTWKNRFSEFMKSEKLEETFESVLAFMKKMSDEYAPSTLWQAYSCLNKYYTTYKNWKSFNEVPILKNFIKAIEKKAEPKKNTEMKYLRISDILRNF